MRQDHDESNWVVKNQVKMHPHFMEKRLYIQKSIAEKLNGEDIAKLVLNNMKDDSNLKSRRGSLFDNIDCLDDISVNFSNSNLSIPSLYKQPAEGYEYMNEKEGSLLDIEFHENQSNHTMVKDSVFSNSDDHNYQKEIEKTVSLQDDLDLELGIDDEEESEELNIQIVE